MGQQKNVAGINDGKIDIMRLFVAFSLIGLVYAFLIAYLSGGDSIRDSLFWNGYASDHFMDFFNTMRDSQDLSWLYQRNIIYPPFSILIMYFFTRLTPAGSLPKVFADRYLMQYDSGLATIFLFFAAVSLLLTALCIERYLENKKIGAERFLIAVFCIVSFPVVYCLERGNSSLFAVAASAFFIFFRNSESRLVREISYLMLAAAAGLKLFPAVFGLLLIYDKKYFAAFRTVIYGIIFVAAPYFLIGALTPEQGGLVETMQSVGAEVTHTDGTAVSADGSFGRFIQNLIRWVEKRSFFSYDSTSVMNLFYLLYAVRVLPPKLAQTGSFIAFVATELIAFVLGFFCKREWQKVFICTYLMLNVQSVAMHYTLIYMMPALVVFLAESREERRKPLNITYLVLFAVQFVFLPFFFFRSVDEFTRLIQRTFDVIGPTSFNKGISCFAFQLLALVVLIDIIVCAIVRAREKKKVASSIRIRKAQSVSFREA